MNFSLRSRIFLRTVRYGIMLMLLSLLQTSFFPVISEKLAPDLVMAAVVAVSFFEGEKTAGICGLAGGFMIYAMTGCAVPFEMLFYTLTGYLCGVLIRYLLKRNFVSYMVFLTASYAVKALFMLLSARVNSLNISFVRLMTDEWLAGLLPTLALAVPLYLIIRIPFRGNGDYEYAGE